MDNLTIVIFADVTVLYIMRYFCAYMYMYVMCTNAFYMMSNEWYAVFTLMHFNIN